MEYDMDELIFTRIATFDVRDRPQTIGSNIKYQVDEQFIPMKITYLHENKI